MTAASLGSWVGSVVVAKALMRPVFEGGLITLRAQSKQKRALSLHRVLVSTWLYSLVFVIVSTAFVGVSLLRRDPGDFFGFRRHVLSAEYLINPQYATVLAAATIAAIVASLCTFGTRARHNPIDPDAFDTAWNSGAGAFFAVAVIGLLLSMWTESVASGA